MPSGSTRHATRGLNFLSAHLASVLYLGANTSDPAVVDTYNNDTSAAMNLLPATIRASTMAHGLGHAVGLTVENAQVAALANPPDKKKPKCKPAETSKHDER